MLRIDYPEELVGVMQSNVENCEQKLRFLLAAKLYELGEIGSGYGAKLAGITRIEFLEQLGSVQVSVFNYGMDALEQEIEGAYQRAQAALTSQQK